MVLYDASGSHLRKSKEKFISNGLYDLIFPSPDTEVNKFYIEARYLFESPPMAVIGNATMKVVAIPIEESSVNISCPSSVFAGDVLRCLIYTGSEDGTPFSSDYCLAHFLSQCSRLLGIELFQVCLTATTLDSTMSS